MDNIFFQFELTVDFRVFKIETQYGYAVRFSAWVTNWASNYDCSNSRCFQDMTCFLIFFVRKLRTENFLNLKFEVSKSVVGRCHGTPWGCQF